jgi:RNA polymerase sigma factor (sigma-70 family)
METSDELFEKNLSLVYKVFNDCFDEYRYIEDDLLQEGRYALWMASKAFIKDDDFAAFSTFAYKCIKNAMLGYVKRGNKERAVVVSINDKAGSEDALTYEQTLGVSDDVSAECMMQLILDCTIDERERLIVRRKAYGFSQKQIAVELKISEMRVSEIVRSLHKRVEAKLEEMKK